APRSWEPWPTRGPTSSENYALHPHGAAPEHRKDFHVGSFREFHPGIFRVIARARASVPAPVRLPVRSEIGEQIAFVAPTFVHHGSTLHSQYRRSSPGVNYLTPCY